MSLTTRIADHVNPGVRSRGSSYFRDGVVNILEGDEDWVFAVVEGMREYEVDLSRSGTVVEASCTCPYVESNWEVCKHIWATLLEAERQELLSGDTPGTPLSGIYLDAEEPEGREDDEERDLMDALRRFEAPVVRTPSRPAPKPPRPSPPDWKAQLASANEQRRPQAYEHHAWDVDREIMYIVDVPATLEEGGGLVVDVSYRQRKMDGEWGAPRHQSIAAEELPHLPDPADREILAILAGPERGPMNRHSWEPPRRIGDIHALVEPLPEVVIPMMCRTGRCWLKKSRADKRLQPIRWDDGGAWDLVLKVAPEEDMKNYRIEGALQRGDEEMPLAKPHLLYSGGVVFCDDWAAHIEDHGAFQWVVILRQQGAIRVPVTDKDEFLERLFQMSMLPKLVLPEELECSEVALTPRPRLRLQTVHQQGWHDSLVGEASFDYDGQIVVYGTQGRGVYDAEKRRFILRCPATEASLMDRLRDVGFRVQNSYGQEDIQLPPRLLPRVVRTLIDEDWHIEAEGKVYRSPGAFQIAVRSGIDWFELHGTVEFGDVFASLPGLLKALQRGENTVVLDDGTVGVVPEEWLNKYGILTGLGTPHDQHIRFKRTQVGVLDALLAAQPEADVDEVFARARDQLAAFQGVEPSDPPDGFVGQLRGYQRDGLGWLDFLQRFGFGGCLADDMGLGKTVQVLALLESRRALRNDDDASPKPGPSLVVVPKSIVFNWQQEAARFTPNLRVLDNTGTGRCKDGSNFHDYDAIITTYGTLRRDAPDLKDVRFDYCILDESQAIKNPNTATAKAARLIQADHRLALSGTPIENHLGELWSLFEFLNPGMLGKATVFRLTGAGAVNPDPDTRALLSHAVRPFILRRTKDQVATDLPPKVEQTLYCELEPSQRKLYDELRDHYRQSLLAKVESDGLHRAKIQILEALLRLRQAAIHPGLIDKAKAGKGSAKLDMLLPQLMEVFEEGHKALVFSQFTKMLAIVRDRLDHQNIPYQYLDGRTRKRGEKVEHFQNDPDCKLFLISLKAGGLGLNLTAAEYVFLLDPWWNPAVEAQAIDRTHRIGQTRHVFAYRLIARDTVEEKVLELQQTKRELADSIISADNSLIRNLRKEDLALLLS